MRAGIPTEPETIEKSSDFQSFATGIRELQRAPFLLRKQRQKGLTAGLQDRAADFV